ncbi:MAG: hypothetical protein R3C05_28930 [Pirellulaceae bacterium]
MKERLSISVVCLLALATMPAYAGGIVRLAEEPTLSDARKTAEVSKVSKVKRVAYQNDFEDSQYAESLPSVVEPHSAGQPVESYVEGPTPPVATYHQPGQMEYELTPGPTYPVGEPFAVGPMHHAGPAGPPIPPFAGIPHSHGATWAGPVACEFDYGCGPSYVVVPRKKCCYRQPTFLGLGCSCVGPHGRSCNTCCNGYCVGRGNKYCNDGCCRKGCCNTGCCGDYGWRGGCCYTGCCKPRCCVDRNCTKPVGNNCWNNGGGNMNHCCHPCYSTGLRTALNDLLFW